MRSRGQGGCPLGLVSAWALELRLNRCLDLGIRLIRVRAAEHSVTGAGVIDGKVLRRHASSRNAKRLNPRRPNSACFTVLTDNP